MDQRDYSFGDNAKPIDIEVSDTKSAQMNILKQYWNELYALMDKRRGSSGKDSYISGIVNSYTVTAFAIRNFKAFREDSGWIQIKPLTLLMGMNSSGKSALYQVLRMLKFSNEKMARESRFEDLSVLEELSGNFSDICNKNVLDQDVVFRFLIVTELNPAQKIEYRISLSKALNGDYGTVNKVEIIEDEVSRNLLEYYESGNLFFLIRKDGQEIPGELALKVEIVLNALERFADSIQVVSAHRAIPERVMQLTGTRPRNLGEDGSQSYNYLFSFSDLENDEVDLINKWLDKFGYSWFWKERGKNRGEFMLRNTKTGIESNIVDNGFGISQSLPLAVYVAALKDGLLVIDTPEAFLQTNMQSELGDLLIMGAKRGHLLIETGSEYVLYRIRRRVAEGTLSSEQVALYFIEEDDEANTICRVSGISPEGDLLDTSRQFETFFSSDFNDMEIIDDLRRKRYLERTNK